MIAGASQSDACIEVDRARDQLGVLEAEQEAQHQQTVGGTPGRVCLSVAGDEPAAAKQVVLRLVGELGFDGLDAGSLAESWRQQPGTPALLHGLGPDRTADGAV